MSITVFAAGLTAIAASGTIILTVTRFITKLGKNTTTWSIVQEAFTPEKGLGLMERVSHMEESLARIEKRMP